MRKVFELFTVVILITLLSACNQERTYIQTDITLDGNPVYYYETDYDTCITLYSTTLEITEDMDYEILYMCNTHKVVLYEGEYISLISYISEHLVSVDDLVRSNLGNPIYYDSIVNLLEIDLNDFTLEEIIIRTLNNEYQEYGGEWTEDTTINLTIQEISEGISNVLATKVKTEDVCDNTMCIIFGNRSPGSVLLTNGDIQLRIDFFKNRYEIYYGNDNSFIYIYDIDMNDDNDILMTTILNEFNEQ